MLLKQSRPKVIPFSPSSLWYCHLPSCSLFSCAHILHLITCQVLFVLFVFNSFEFPETLASCLVVLDLDSAPLGSMPHTDNLSKAHIWFTSPLCLNRRSGSRLPWGFTSLLMIKTGNLASLTFCPSATPFLNTFVLAVQNFSQLSDDYTMLLLIWGSF